MVEVEEGVVTEDTDTVGVTLTEALGDPPVGVPGKEKEEVALTVLLAEPPTREGVLERESRGEVELVVDTEPEKVPEGVGDTEGEGLRVLPGPRDAVECLLRVGTLVVVGAGVRESTSEGEGELDREAVPV